MTRRRAIALAYLLTLATVPWTAGSSEGPWGIPAWALYSLLVTAAACAFLAWGLGARWGDDDG